MREQKDEDGLCHYAGLLDKAEFSPSEIATMLAISEEASNKILPDHSQFGEFRLLLRHFVNSASKHQLVVDVGTNGCERSNAYDLMKNFGWRGLLVEANPDLWSAIERDFAGLDYSLAKCAISDSEGEMPLFIGINSDVSSLRREAAEAWGAIQGEIKVKVRRLGVLLDEYFIPKDFDVLSLDIEGLDIEVLNDLLGFTDYRPEVVIIEASMNFRHQSLDDTHVSERVSVCPKKS